MSRLHWTVIFTDNLFVRPSRYAGPSGTTLRQMCVAIFYLGLHPNRTVIYGLLESRKNFCYLRLVGYRPTETLKNAQFFGFGPIPWLDSLDDDVSIHVLFVNRVAIVTETPEFLVRLESPASTRDAQGFRLFLETTELGTD
jgi:hypothetical protein